jgi:hypothetical protein
MALSADQIAKVNTMCGGAAAAALGTAVGNLEAQAIKRGTHTAISADATANKVEFSIAGITTWIVQIFRDGVNVTGDAVVTYANSKLTVADGASTYAVTAGDVINYIVW